jgi:hypothetical protein
VLPSRVWDDTSVWIGLSAGRRSLAVNGRFTNGRYHLDATASPKPPAHVAEARHIINLTRLSPDEYAWDTDVAFAVGGIPAPRVAAFIGALFSAAEGRGEPEMRADYRATIPRTVAVLQQLFGIDSIRTTRGQDGATLATFWVVMTPSGVARRYPHFARYLTRYVQSGKMRWALTDRSGATYFESSVANGRLVLRLRTQDGALVPISGPIRPRPDTLTLNGEFTMRVHRFTMGFHDYHAEFTVAHTDHERAWTIVSRREPAWELPLITERLLRTPLRRPFQGSGAHFRIGVRDDSTEGGGQSILYRRLHLEVQESLILRFIGHLGAIAVNDFAGDVEREQNAWLAEAFGALAADVRAFP